ncbi:hypothetical protein P692DRAFT_20749482, partial [Suillus brevipes Sb2]
LAQAHRSTRWTVSQPWTHSCKFQQTGSPALSNKPGMRICWYAPCQHLPLPTTITPEPNPDQSSDSGCPHQSEQPHPKRVKAALAKAKGGIDGIRLVSGKVENVASASDHLQSVPDTIDSFSKILKTFEKFHSVATTLTNVHPYAKVALGIFTCASKMIFDQANRDDQVSRLLLKISEVYALLMEGEGLARIASMPEICEKIARQTLECADFVVHYSDMKSFCESFARQRRPKTQYFFTGQRLRKQVFDETDAMIQRHNEVLDNLMQQFRDKMALTSTETVHRIGKIIFKFSWSLV